MKNRKVIIGITILAIFIILFGWRYYTINKQFPPAEVEKYKFNEDIYIDKIKYTVIKDGIANVENSDDSKLYYVKVLIENTDNKDVDVIISDIELRFGNEAYALSLDYLIKFNNISNVYTMKSGEKISVTIPYDIYKENIPDNNLDNIMDYVKELTFTKYPKKIVVEL